MRTILIATALLVGVAMAAPAASVEARPARDLTSSGGSITSAVPGPLRMQAAVLVLAVTVLIDIAEEIRQRLVVLIVATLEVQRVLLGGLASLGESSVSSWVRLVTSCA